MTDSTSTESTIPPEKIEAFMKFRPAVRIVYYTITPDGRIKVMLGMHAKNQELTLPGGRFDSAKDISPGYSLVDNLWHNTMFREIWEELREDDMGILGTMMAGNFKHLGIVVWKHPERKIPCIDFVAAIYCSQKIDFDLNHKDELSEIRWVDWFEGENEPSKYVNVRLAIEMLYEQVDQDFGQEAPKVLYDDDEFSDEEIEQIGNKLRKILS